MAGLVPAIHVFRARGK